MANQHASPKRKIRSHIAKARAWLNIAAAHYESGRGLPYRMACRWAREYVDAVRALIDAAPASTRRRWKAGR